METEYLLNVAIDIATTEFASFCAQRFSLSCLINSKLLKTATALIQFRLELIAGDGYEDARIEFKPAPGGQCILDFNPSDVRSGSVLEDRGLAIAEMIFFDFVIYLSQRGYLQDDANRAHEGRTTLMGELRELDAKLPEYASGLRARHQTERGLLPADKEPLSQVYTGLTTLRQRLEQGNLEELVDTLKWYLDAYSEFPQLVARRRAPRTNQKGPLKLGAPGRPRNKAYDTAYLSIQSGEKDYKGAFEWFCQNQSITKPDKLARDSFRAAMKRRHIDT